MEREFTIQIQVFDDKDMLDYIQHYVDNYTIASIECNADDMILRIHYFEL